MTDLVYIVRPGENEELRYSLRSAVNLPHDRVWIIGSCPEWVRGVQRFRMVPKKEKWANIRQSLTYMAACEEVDEDVVLMCDDFFILEQLEELPVIHLGPLDEYISRTILDRQDPNNTWFRGMVEMATQLKAWGVDNPLSYEGHMPMPYNRSQLSGLLESSSCRFLWGCAYSATDGPAGVRGFNAKVRKLDQAALNNKLRHGQPFLSTNEVSFADGAVGKYLRQKFPKPGPYEK